MVCSCRLKWLRDRFNQFPGFEDEDEWRTYTAALIMEIIGTLIVPDASGDTVPSMYAQFIDFDRPVRYSWASALLACLYRNLCAASHVGTRSIAGPMYFLQVFLV